MPHEAIVELILALTIIAVLLGALATVLVPFGLLSAYLRFELLDLAEVVVLLPELLYLLFLAIIEFLLNADALS